MFECKIRKDIYPKQGEVVIGKITSITEDVIIMNLLEYGDLTGLILNGELSKKKFKTVSQITKVGNVEVCQVLKVEEAKGFIDLSLKRVSEEDKKLCKENFSKAKLSYQIINKACKISNESIKNVYENWAYKKEEEFGSIFLFFAHAKNHPEILDAEPNGNEYKKVIDEQFKASTFKVKVEVDVTCIKGGINSIKEAFGKANEFDDELEITLIKSPTYSIVKIGNDKDETFESINKVLEIVKQAVMEIGGNFTIVNAAKLYGEKSRHTMLDVNDQKKERSSDEESDESD
jgi:translation initiation factor 2 subunit 1